MIIPSFPLTPFLWFSHLIIVHVRSSHRYARKRAFRHELDVGPFPVTGQDIRKATSAHARHQIHSYFGTGRINYEKDLSGGTSRGLGTCCVCAVSHWREDLLPVDLFLKPKVKEAVHSEEPSASDAPKVKETMDNEQPAAFDASDVHSEASGSDEEDDAGVVGGRRQGAEDNSKAVPLNDHSNASCSDEENHAGAVGGRRQVAHDRNSVRQLCPEGVERINGYLSAHVYHQNWDRMPWRELLATSVIHPHGKDKKGNPWRWLLDTKALPKVCDGQGGFDAADQTYAADDDGVYPPVPMCGSCYCALSKKQPNMPVFALANDNLMLREPFVFRNSERARLSPSTFTMLQLARMVIKKVVAEKSRKADPATKQKGMRSNTICFPQATCTQLITEALPAEPQQSIDFISKTISIALAGCDVEDLDSHRDFQVPYEEYMTCVRFLVAHSEAYMHLQIDEEEGRRRFLDECKSCAEILQQATKVASDGPVPLRLDGPASFDEPEVAPLKESLGDDEGVNEP